MKNSPEGLKSRFDQAEGIISELKDKSIKIIQCEKQKEKKEEK